MFVVCVIFAGDNNIVLYCTTFDVTNTDYTNSTKSNIFSFHFHIAYLSCLHSAHTTKPLAKNTEPNTAERSEKQYLLFHLCVSLVEWREFNAICWDLWLSDISIIQFCDETWYLLWRMMRLDVNNLSRCEQTSSRQSENYCKNIQWNIIHKS